MRKYEPIDLMKLYTHGSMKGWNEMLTTCLKKRDINRLAKLRYQISAGMDDLAKLKLNTEQMNVWFVRLMKSLELTAKRIIKIRHPMPGDNPLIVKDFGQDHLAIKRKRDQELMQFLRDSGY